MPLNESGAMRFAVRASTMDATMLASLRRAVLATDPNALIGSADSYEVVVSRTMSVERYRTGLIVGVAVLAVVLAGIGVFSVTARVVAGRSREFGVRVALGAERRRLVWDVVGQHVPGSIGGVVLGLVLARAGGRLIAAFLFGVEPADAPTFILVALVMSVLALVATYLPVLRGTRLDPAAVLRPE